MLWKLLFKNTVIINKKSITFRILSPGCKPCNEAGLPGCTAVTKIPAKLPPVSRIPTEPSLRNVTNLASGLKIAKMRFVGKYHHIIVYNL